IGPPDYYLSYFERNGPIVSRFVAYAPGKGVTFVIDTPAISRLRLTRDLHIKEISLFEPTSPDSMLFLPNMIGFDTEKCTQEHWKPWTGYTDIEVVKRPNCKQ